MATLIQKIKIANDFSTPITLMLEPWGQDYVMLPEEIFDVVAHDISEDFYFHIAYQTEYISVYAEGDCYSVSVIQNENLLKCGHNREKIS